MIICLPSSATAIAASSTFTIPNPTNVIPIHLPKRKNKKNPNATPLSSTFHVHFPQSVSHAQHLHLSFSHNGRKFQSPFSSMASSSSVECAEYIEEPATNTKFPTSLSIAGCSSLLSVIGTGYREKVFAIIGVKVYAAAFYLNPSIVDGLNSFRGQSEADIQGNPSMLFQSIYQSPLEKSLRIALVRDVDGKTFWDALDEAISPRIKSPDATDEPALSTFHGIFLGRPLKKGTSIFLTWVVPSKMLVSISSGGLSAGVDATIESVNVTNALFDVFFGDTPISPSLKASVVNGLLATFYP